MNPVAGLRAELFRLLRRRAVVRWGSALAAALTGAVLLLGAAYLLDWSLRLPWLARVGLLAAWLAGLWSVVRKWSWPLIAMEETITDAALWVENRHRVDSDLVAALQFAGGSCGGGSPRLSAAVVESVAEYAKGLDVLEGFRWAPLPRRVLNLLGVVLLAALVVVPAPAYALVFWQRFLLGDARYPTETQITALEINGQSISPLGRGDRAVTVVAGQPLRIAIQTAGKSAARADVILRRSTGHAAGDLTLTRSEAQRTTDDGHQSWQGELTQLTEAVQFIVRAGDAETDPVEISVRPLPVVVLEWSVAPPSYAQGRNLPPADVGAGTRNLTLLAGSRVGLTARSENKDLKLATCRIDDAEFPLTPCAADGKRCWSLPSGTPFDSLQATLRYSLQVEDADGLSMPAPLTGQIRLKADRLPRVAAAVLSKVVLPSGKPRVSCGATDDFGLTSLKAAIDVKREDGTTGRHELSLKTLPTTPAPQLTLREDFPIDLTPYALQKGDEVRITIAARDWRGDLEPQVGLSEPLVLMITDRNGILASLIEADQQSARQLDAIIRRELGIGGDQ